MRKTRSQTQAENGPSVSTRSLARSAATKTSSSSAAATTKDNDKDESAFGTSNPTPPPSQSSASNQSNRRAPEIDSAKLKEYQDMIQSFRVVDLHKVLQFLSQSIAGRKHELQQRVLDLLKTNFELVSTKLREIYRTEFYNDRANQYGPPDPKRMFSHMQMPTVQSTGDVRSAMVNVGNVGGAGGVGGQGAPAGNGGAAVPGTMGVPFQHAIASMPIHPDVRLKKLAFYDVLATLIKPSSLLPRTNQRIQELPFYFTLTPQQATEIATNRDIRNGSKVEHSIQVQLRFCLLETSCEQEDCFPSNVIVKVNNKLCPLPNPIPTNRPNVEPKRPPRPVNVTSNVKLSPTVTNTVTVQWCPDFSRGYCIAAYLVKKLTSSQLLHRMKTKGIKPADYTRGLIKEKLTEDADCEIATTMLKVSLNCPLGKMKMSIPCRASTCSHLQCFDANLYLQMNERKPTWNCPVCDKPAIYDHLVIDGYFQEVLASSLLGSEDTEIQLHKDGSWSTHNLRNETQMVDTPSKPVEKVELISDDIELITDDVKPLAKAPPPPVISNEPTSTTNSETVDLTLSDSDDDMPLAKRKTATSKNAAAAAAATAVSTSNGQRSATAQSSSHKGATEGSLNVDDQSLKPNCPFTIQIRQFLKTSDNQSAVSTTIPSKPTEKEKTITNNNKQKDPKQSAKEQTNVAEKYLAVDINSNVVAPENVTATINNNNQEKPQETAKEQTIVAENSISVDINSNIVAPENVGDVQKSDTVKNDKPSSDNLISKKSAKRKRTKVRLNARLNEMEAKIRELQESKKSSDAVAVDQKPDSKPGPSSTKNEVKVKGEKRQDEKLTTDPYRGWKTNLEPYFRNIPINELPIPIVETKHVPSTFKKFKQKTTTDPFKGWNANMELLGGNNEDNPHLTFSSYSNSVLSKDQHVKSSSNEKLENAPQPLQPKTTKPIKSDIKSLNNLRRIVDHLSKPDVSKSIEQHIPGVGRIPSRKHSMQIPSAVDLNDLLELVTADIYSLNNLSPIEKQRFSEKQALALLLLQRCKQWRRTPKNIQAAIELGLF